MPPIPVIDRGKAADVLLLNLINAGVTVTGIVALLGVDDGSLTAHLVRVDQFGRVRVLPVPFHPDQINLVPSQTVTATGNTGNLTLPDRSSVRVNIAVTGITGAAPSVTFSLQARNLSGNFVTIIATPAFTATGSASLEVDKMPTTYRILWTFAGTTTNITFDIDASFEAEG